MIEQAQINVVPNASHVTHYTATYTLEDGSKHPYETDTNVIYCKEWNNHTDSVNRAGVKI